MLFYRGYRHGNQIPTSISFVYDSMEEPSVSAVDGSLQLKRNRSWRK